MKKTIFVLSLLLLAFSGCMPGLSDRQSSQSIRYDDMPLNQNTETAIPILEPRETRMPTETRTAAPTATPTVTNWPVTNGTPVPNLDFAVITAKNINRLQQIARYGNPVPLSPLRVRLTDNGQALAVGNTLGIQFFNASTLELVSEFPVEFLSDFDITPDGSYVLTRTGNEFSLWGRMRKLHQRLSITPRENIYRLDVYSLSPDGRYLAVASGSEADSKIKVVRLSDGATVNEARGEGVRFLSENMAVYFDNAVYLFPLNEIESVRWNRLPKLSLPWCHWSTGTCEMYFSPDSRLSALVHQDGADIYDVATRKLVRQLKWSMDTHKNPDNLPEFHFVQNHLVLVKVEDMAQVLDITTGATVSSASALRPENSLTWYSNQQIRQVALMSNPYKWGDELFVDNQGQISLMNFYGFERCNPVKAQCEQVSGFLFDEKLNAYSLVLNEDTQKFEVRDESRLLYSIPAANFVGARLFAGNLVAIYSRGGYSYEVIVMNPDGRTTRVAGEAPRIFFSGRWIGIQVRANGGRDSAIWVDLQDWKIHKTGSKNEVLATQDAFALLYSLKDGFVLVDNSDGGRILHRQTIQQKSFLSCYPDAAAFGHDFVIADTGCGNLGVFSQVDMSLIFEMTAASGPLRAMNFSPDGRLLATIGQDGFIRLWAVLQNPE